MTNATTRTKVALLFGGRSAEHDVSILSARSIFEAAPKERFQMIPVCIALDGHFLPPEVSAAVLAGTAKAPAGDLRFSFESWLREETIDIVFPIIHGTYGEDGTLQGYLEIIDVPYVGSGVTGSAVGMDKWVMKHAFAAAGLPIVERVEVSEWQWQNAREKVAERASELPLPWFVKPANAGSSVGVSKVKSADGLAPAIDGALRFDDKVLIEHGVIARELEVSVLGNDVAVASLPGEIISGHEFYDYEDKYIDTGSRTVVPAVLPEEIVAEIKRLALIAFRIIGASGYARVDFFLERESNRLLVNEINTAPGFTKISMYPKMWAASGLPFPELIARLIDLGFERHRSRAHRFAGMMRFFDEVKSLT
jgi:D-alanine-D-alanine ligase